MDKTDKNTIEELLPVIVRDWQRKKSVCKLRRGWMSRKKTGGWPNRYMLSILLQILFTS